MFHTIDNTQTKEVYNRICQAVLDDDANTVRQVLQSISQEELQDLFSYLENEDNLLLFVYKNLTQDKAIIQTLIDFNQYLYLEDEKGDNILWILAKQKDYALLRYCLGKSPKMVNYVNIKGESLVDIALLSFDLELLRTVLYFNPANSIFNKFILSKDSLLCVGVDIKVTNDAQQKFIQTIYDHLVTSIHKEAIESGVGKMSRTSREKATEFKLKETYLNNPNFDASSK